MSAGRTRLLCKREADANVRTLEDHVIKRRRNLGSFGDETLSDSVDLVEPHRPEILLTPNSVGIRSNGAGRRGFSRRDCLHHRRTIRLAGCKDSGPVLQGGVVDTDEALTMR